MCASRDTLSNWACQKGHPVLEVAVEMSGTRVRLYLPKSDEPSNHFTDRFGLDQVNKIEDLLNKSEKWNDDGLYYLSNIEDSRIECVSYLDDVSERLKSSQSTSPLVRKTLEERILMLKNLDAYDSRMGHILNKNYAEELFSLLLLASATQFYTEVLYNLLQKSPELRKYEAVAIFTKNKILWGLPLFILLERPTYYLVESEMRPLQQNQQSINQLLICQGEDKPPFTEECQAIFNQVNQCRLYAATHFNPQQFSQILQQYGGIHFSGHSDGHSLRIQNHSFGDIPNPLHGRFCFLACCYGVKNTKNSNTLSVGERFLNVGTDILIAGYWILANDPMKTFSPLFYFHAGNPMRISVDQACKAIHDAREEYNNKIIRRGCMGFLNERLRLARRMPDPTSLWNWGILQVFVPIRCGLNNCVKTADNACAT